VQTEYITHMSIHPPVPLLGHRLAEQGNGGVN